MLTSIRLYVHFVPENISLRKQKDSKITSSGPDYTRNFKYHLHGKLDKELNRREN